MSPRSSTPRRSLLIGAAFLTTASLVAACTGERDGDDPVVGTDELVSVLDPAKGDVDRITWALPTGEPETLDPINSVTYSSGTVVQNLCEPLLATQPDFSHEPGLATAEVVSPTEIVYTINPDATFWDGSPVTAEDVAFSLTRASDPNAVVGFMYINVASITATAADQVTVTFSQPDELFNNEMASIGGAIVQKAYAEEKGADFGTPAGGLMCSGPFTLDSWESGSKVSISRNETYWKADGRAFAAGVDFVFVSDSTALTQALQSGEIDGAYELPAASVAALQNAESGRLVFGPSSQSVNLYIAQPGGPFEDDDLRNGLSKAIDRESLASVIFHGAARANYTLLTPATWGADVAELYQPDYDRYAEARAFDVEAAQKLIDASGYDGEEFVMGILAGDETASQTAQLIQQQAKAVGVEISIEALQPLVYAQAGYDLAARDGLDLYLSPSFNGVADPLEPLGFQMLPGQAYNYVGYDDAEVTRLLTEARGEFDATARAELIIQAQAIYEETAAAHFPLLSQNTATFLSNDLTGAVTSFAYWSMPQMAYIGAAE